MTKFIHKIGGMMALAALGVASFTSCSEEIDDSNLYTFTGQTVIDYLRSDSTLSDIAKISDRAGMSELTPASPQPTRHSRFISTHSTTM